MTFLGRFLRRAIVAIIFLSLISWLGYGVYGSFFPVIPTCTDGIKNQGEEGVDCGAVCRTECPPKPRPEGVSAIDIEWAKVINSDINSYDLVAKINNPNKYWGLQNYEYTFTIKDNNETVVLVKNGRTYILPDGYDYVIIPSVKINGTPVKADFKIAEDSEVWKNVNNDYNVSSLSFPIRDKKYSVKDENGFPSASGILVNDTTYDFDRINIKIVLYSEDGDAIAANVTDRRTMLAKDEQYIRSIWNLPPPKEVFRYDFIATTNIFDSQNFMRRYGTSEIHQ